MKSKELTGGTLPETTICEKAHVIYGDLKEKIRATSKETAEDIFKASNGWFENFKKRIGIRLVVQHGKAMSATVKVTEEFIAHFAALVPKEEYIPSTGVQL